MCCLNLCYSDAIPARNRRDEPVHFTIELQVLNDVSPVCLQGTSVIVEVYSGDFADQGIREDRGEPSRQKGVFPFFPPAAYQIIPFIEFFEQHRDIYEPLDLRFGACRLVVAEPAELREKDDPRSWSYLRVATKYPNLAEQFFSRKGIQAEIIKLTGSLELAPLVGLAERIVDLVATGQTLRENGLVEVEEIARATARLIVNRASLKTKYLRVQALIEQIRKQVERRQGGARE